jgi:hypothetical protein
MGQTHRTRTAQTTGNFVTKENRNDPYCPVPELPAQVVRVIAAYFTEHKISKLAFHHAVCLPRKLSHENNPLTSFTLKEKNQSNT